MSSLKQLYFDYFLLYPKDLLVCILLFPFLFYFLAKSPLSISTSASLRTTKSSLQAAFHFEH
ncbi:hypothetical protein BDF14DRAFT_1748578 [Spinellus fusiger]|nr:hypothetical protein BDF14DRAFT_1748578 [Spinellus fusiger]